MADLYTSQVHLKRLLAGQATAAFTPAPEAVLKVLDPAFFPGMGALREDSDGRLQCPVRGCGEWHLKLGQHVARQHRSIGVDGLRDAIGLPRRVSMLSRTGKARAKSGGGRPFKKGNDNTLARKAAMAAMQARDGQSAARRNWADTCPAQLQSRIVELARKVGHTPTIREFAAEYGHGMRGAIADVFGTWNNAKAMAGLSASPRQVGVGGWNGSGGLMPEGSACESLRVWVDTHGDLPSYQDIHSGKRSPMIPSYPTLLRVFGVDNWQAAMRSAAQHLSIKSERYGIDARRKTA